MVPSKPAPFNILVSDHLHESGWELLLQTGDANPTGPFTNREQVLAAVSEAHALIIRSTTQVDSEMLEAAPDLKVIARAGAQLDNVDIEAATHLGILVIHVPDANVTAVAEHTLAMMLAFARDIPRGYNEVREGKWPRHTMLGFQLNGKLLGIIGFGRLGREVAARAQAFGMHILAYDPFVDLSFARQQGVEIVNFNELLERADILTLHTSLTDQTRGMLNAAAFARMKPGAILINCAHAGLVDEDALLQALKQGKLGGTALDTFAQEPPPEGSPLIQHPRVLPMPHLNQNTVESQSETSRQVVQDVLAALRGEDYRHVVNLPFSETVPYLALKPYIHLASKLGKLQGQLTEGWITRVEVELLGENLRDLVRPVAAVLLSGMLRQVGSRAVNWVSAPVLAFEQGITTAQAKELVKLADYPNLIACRVYWNKGPEGQADGHRTVAGVLFGNGEARLVQYDQYSVDAYPEGYVLILENDDVPGVIGKVGTRLGRAQINIAQWRYGRESRGGQAVSFINLDDRVPETILAELENETEIRRARLVHL
jgi:D-3-phosphoglycerate dehydrogenase